jgi:serine/threonine protein kinase
MEEWLTAHEESLNSVEVNTSEDTKNSVKQEPSFEHGESSSTQPSSSPSSSSVYHSARIESMMKDRSKFSSELEFNIQYSKYHWSQLTIPGSIAISGSIADTDDDDDTEHSPEAEVERFNRLCRWGGFFKDFDQSLVVGEKIAEGAQAEIYAATLFGSYECILKMFKQGYALSDLQRQWPKGIMKSYTKIPLEKETGGTCAVNMHDGKGYSKFECIHGGTLLRDERFKNRFAFVMKRQWGDLRKVIDLQMLGKKNHGGPFPFKIQRLLMLNIARGMRDLHQKSGIIHRDLKASNVLVPCSYDTPGFGSIVTVTDFECSIGVIGTRFCRALEIFQQLKIRVPASKIRFSFAADVYSYGMTCYEIITGCIPFEGYPTGAFDAVLNGKRPELPCDAPQWIRRLIYDCWHPNPFRRPYFSDIVQRIEGGTVGGRYNQELNMPTDREMVETFEREIRGR